MSTVAGRVVRSVGFDSFADIVPGVEVADIGEGGVTFTAPLTAAQAEQVRARMTSRDDADQAARANLAALRDAARTGDLESVRALSLALTAYLLGET